MLTQDEIAMIVADNLTTLRKRHGLTQGDLAAKFNYSDKSVSKWEHGEATPDLATLQQLADFYGVTIDFLTHVPTPDNIALYTKSTEQKDRINRRIFCALVIVVIWTLAVIVYAGIQILHYDGAWHPWMAFIWALPISCLPLIFYAKKWHHKNILLCFTIAFSWLLLLAFYLEIGFDVPDSKGWYLSFLFILGVPLTVGAILYTQIYKK